MVFREFNKKQREKIVHIRSIDRKNPNMDRISNYEVDIKNANISPDEGELLTCQLVNAQIPNSNYVIDAANDSLTLIFNDGVYATPQKYYTSMTDVQWYKKSGVPLADGEGGYLKTGPESGWVGVMVRADTYGDGTTAFVYADPKLGDLYFHTSAVEIRDSETDHGKIRVPIRREFPIKLTHGNYNVDTLQTELQSKFEDALNTTKIETFTLNNSSEDLSKNEYVYLRNELMALHTSYSTEEQESSPYRDLDGEFIFDENHTGYIPNYRDITTTVNHTLNTNQEIIELGNGVFQSAADGKFFTAGGYGAEVGNFVLLGNQVVASQNGVYKILEPGTSDTKAIISKVIIPTSAVIYDTPTQKLYTRTGDTDSYSPSTPELTEFYGVRTGQSIDYDGSIDSSSTGLSFAFAHAKIQVEYDDQQNRFTFRRGDGGGLFQTGGFQISSGSNRLAIVLGLPHLVTQQQLTTSDFYSAGVLIESINKYKPSGISEIINNPEENKYRLHYAVSYNCVNVHAEDTVYIRAQNLRVNGVETFDGNQQNLLAKVPLSVGGNGIEFHEPLAPFICDLGNGSGSGVDRLRILLTDGQRQEIDFQGVNHSMTILFTIYKKGDEGGSTMDNTNNESRRPNLVKPDFNRYRAS